MKLCLVLYAMIKFLKLQMMACANEIIADMKNYPNIQGEQTVRISLILTLRSLVACSPYPQSGKLVISTALVSTPCFLTHSRNSGIAFSLSSGGQLRPEKSTTIHLKSSFEFLSFFVASNATQKRFSSHVIINCYPKQLSLLFHLEFLKKMMNLIF